MTSLIRGLNEPFGVAVSGADLFVTNFAGGTVGEYTTSGATVNASLITGSSYPEGVAVSGSDLFVTNGNDITNGNKVGLYTTSGATVNASLITGLNTPDGVAVSGSVKKSQGVRLGRPVLLPTEVVERIIAERDAGATWAAIGKALDTDSVPTAQGGARWYPATVRSTYISNKGA